MSFSSGPSSRTTGTVSSYFYSSVPPDSPSLPSQRSHSQASQADDEDESEVEFEDEFEAPSNHSPSVSSSRPSVTLTTTSTAISRPSTPSGRRSRRGATPSILGQSESNDIICAVSESRGITPTVGIAIVNLSLGEVTLSQICDNQSYVKTIHKLQLASPSRIVFTPSACAPNRPSTFFSLVENLIPEAETACHERSAWSESAGIEYMEHLALDGDIGPLKVATQGKYYAVCCLSAVSHRITHLSTLKKLMVCAPGYEIHRSPVRRDLLSSVSAYWIPTFRRYDDDCNTRDAITGSDAQFEVYQVKRMPLWAIEPYPYAHGRPRAPQ